MGREKEKKRKSGRFQEENTRTKEEETQTSRETKEKIIELPLTGYNWRNTLTNYASISGILAGFCVTFIALILGVLIADTKLYKTDLTFGQIGIFFFGISASLLITSAQYFLCAKDFDIYEVNSNYLKAQDVNIEDEKFRDGQISKCVKYEKWGSWCYNSAIFLMFIGLGFIIAPYHLIIAFIISGIGIGLEIFQMLK